MPWMRRRELLQGPVIRCQITDGTGNLAAIRPDVDFVQVREPSLSTRELSRFVRAAIRLGAKVLVNDRVDVALACGAAGAHLKGGAVSPELIRRIAPLGFVITVACHSEEDVRRAVGADFVLVSPVFSPISKLDTRERLGLAGLGRIAHVSPVPVLALGGITETNARSCLEVGAIGVAGISLWLTSVGPNGR